MQAAIGQSDFFNPHLDAAIPPIIPPMVNANTPMVPYTIPTVDVDSASPPFAADERRNGFTILRRKASGRR